MANVLVLVLSVVGILRGLIDLIEYFYLIRDTNQGGKDDQVQEEATTEQAEPDVVELDLDDRYVRWTIVPRLIDEGTNCELDDQEFELFGSCTGKVKLKDLKSLQIPIQIKLQNTENNSNSSECQIIGSTKGLIFGANTSFMSTK